VRQVNIMKTNHRNTLATVASLAMLLALGACDRNDPRTPGQQLDAALAKAKPAAERLKQEASKAADDTRAMGASAGDKIGDATVSTRVKAVLSSDKQLADSKIDVDTKGGVVTLSGAVANSGARDHALELARNVKGVNSVNDQLAVKAG
jgi:hyperosmotically inducible periplasmic protein